MTLLSDNTIRSAKAKRNNYTIKDGDGLYLQVAPNGTKNWLFRFYWHGVQKRISFGIYPEIGLKAARGLREEARSLVARKIDPRMQVTNVNDTSGITFADFATYWKEFKFKKLAMGRSPSTVSIERRNSTQVQIERYMNKDFLPALGQRTLSTITRLDVLAVLRKIEARNALSIAEKCRTWLNEIFRHALVEGLIEHNPAGDMDIVALPKNIPRNNPYLKMHQLPDFLAALNNYQGSLQTALGVKLLLLTGVRTGELRFALPEQFDLKKELWFIPPENVKQLTRQARTTNKRIPPYIVPLPTQAIEIVKQLLACRYSSQKYLLSHRTEPQLPISENTLNHGIKRMGYQDRLTGHGIRATLSTALNELGYNKEWIEAQLSHSDPNQIRGTYNHAEYVEQRKKMMQEWADRLDEMISK